jgi:NAD-dependent dihydropyrimidine dehydrogenase PreA subunit
MRYLESVLTLRFEPDSCKGCGLCVDVCPHAVFTMLDKRAVLTDRGACMECGACASNCEHGAIHVRAGVGCAAALLAGVGGSPEVACCGSESACATTGEMSP